MLPANKTPLLWHGIIIEMEIQNMIFQADRNNRGKQSHKISQFLGINKYTNPDIVILRKKHNNTKKGCLMALTEKKIQVIGHYIL